MKHPFPIIPFALSERKIEAQLYPGCYPGLNSYWAFSPSLRYANPTF
ncbi:hypothetical protein HMPREF9019_0451 [Hoylesella timonensis CRIS 5C-B1]|uniref:Uncharacterized protein n=1 Tax=Hoylesella timonensis CRIS 5C-B1 TaxID=679189 RepID=D1VZ67_9BACT|nr:hypothetical protein HMPREF9019_0451 [Hoylesella timonensis CRIS 5C-B1]